MHESTIIQRALITVSDKSCILELAEQLHLCGVELLSTGNTAKLLQSQGLPVTPVSEYTGFPEMMDGRLKTLHPKIHGGILGRRDVDEDVMITHDIPDIDLVVVNLYPFQTVSNNPQTPFEEIIENIDIGGPTLIRGAAKNLSWCTVLVDTQDYAAFIEELRNNQGAISHQTRFRLAAKAFAHTAAYEGAIANFFAKKMAQGSDEAFGSTLSLHLKRKESLRYGENPHQAGGFYETPDAPQDSISRATQHQGKPLSYNNIADSDTALECVKTLPPSGCVIVKHANPCGGATADTLLGAYEKAYGCDPTSAFGGIIAVNQTVDHHFIQAVFEKQFVEVLIAPAFTAGALRLAQQKPLCRLLEYHQIQSSEGPAFSAPPLEMRSVNGGILVQTAMNPMPSSDNEPYRVVTTSTPSDSLTKDLHFAWCIVNFVKSNAIVFVKDGKTLGIGAGQMSRIFSVDIAAQKAKEAGFDLQGAVMASDAFFPFSDSIEKASLLGIAAIIQPGGSKRDQEVIDSANQHGIAMVFTGIRCFRH